MYSKIYYNTLVTMNVKLLDKLNSVKFNLLNMYCGILFNIVECEAYLLYYNINNLR